MAVNSNTIAATSPAAASTVVHTETFTNLDANDHCKLICTVQGGTGGTLDIYLQGYDGSQWFDVAALPQLASGAAVRTYSVKLDRRAQPLVTTLNIVTIGVDGTPVLAAGNVDTGDFSDRLRIVFKAGTSTSAGKAQSFTCLASIDDLHDLQLQDITLKGSGSLS